ncbi:PepSY domain-containing protein [Halosquirtibacter laminarini]|uniref:PepSY domain-containing protein n=1 Tax=Halosquirtibacter laminarini TaxID=3374600 RepID=A0AC61NFY9_9BACT|nr:PepSY domain-containing protein [Prolixibacteraceae bacterium]
MKKKILKISRYTHKYLGIILILFFGIMSITGILLNHPQNIENISVPKELIPDTYIPNNWNRSSLKGAIQTDSLKWIIYGRQGVFHYNKSNKKLQPYMAGDYPTSAWGKRCNDILYIPEKDILISATNQGLFKYDNNQWNSIKLPTHDNEIIRITKSKQHIYTLTKSHIYQSNYQSNTLNFKKITLLKKSQQANYSLISLFFELHDGSIWGMTGRIVWDIASIILFFLSISAFYIWYYPKKWKRNRKKKKKLDGEKKARSFYLKYHKKIGWYSLPLSIIITITGMFLTPIFMMLIIHIDLHGNTFHLLKKENPWHDQIRNGYFDNKNEKLLLDCKDGVWYGNPKDHKSPFEKFDIPIPIFGMGTTVFTQKDNGNWLVGSFSGLWEWNPISNRTKPILKVPKQKKPGRPASTFVTSYVKLPDGKNYIFGHYKGLCDTDGKTLSKVFPMPDIVKADVKLPLWNFLFEIHNGRIFRSIIGPFYILIVPLLGLLSCFMLISGTIEYILTRKRKKRRRK